MADGNGNGNGNGVRANRWQSWSTAIALILGLFSAIAIIITPGRWIERFEQLVQRVDTQAGDRARIDGRLDDMQRAINKLESDLRLQQQLRDPRIAELSEKLAVLQGLVSANQERNDESLDRAVALMASLQQLVETTLRHVNQMQQSPRQRGE